MNRGIIVRVLHFTYPVLIFGIALLTWSSSIKADVAWLTPPPVNSGFNFYWNPTESLKNICAKKQNESHALKRVCSS